MKKIVIYQSDLHIGGIQRSLVNLLKRAGDMDAVFDVYIFDRDHIAFPLEFPENVHLYFLKKFPYYYRFLPYELVSRMKRNEIANAAGMLEQGEQYDLAIDFNSYWQECAVYACNIPTKKRIMWVHNDVEIKLQNEYKYRILHFFFSGKLKHYDQFVMVSSGIVEPFYRVNGRFCNVKKNGKHYSVIPNTIDTNEIRKKIEQIDKTNETEKIEQIIEQKTTGECIKVISVGRLCHQKGYDLLLQKVKEVTAIRKDIHFYIAGDGPDQNALMELAEKLAVTEYVTFLGNLKNPYRIMDKMDAFFMMSRYEGQPLAFWEAQTVGLQIIIPKHLEAYTEGIPGVCDVVEALVGLQRKEKRFDPLDHYNQEIKKRFMELV